MAYVYIQDTTKPVITLDSEKTVTEYNEGDELNIIASASDSYDGDIDVELDIPEGAIKDGKLVAGEWTVTITASDKAGNEATPVTVNITVAGNGGNWALWGTLIGIGGAVIIAAVVLLLLFKHKRTIK